MKSLALPDGIRKELLSPRKFGNHRVDHIRRSLWFTEGLSFSIE
jgi:hypothetical protein